MRYQVGVVDEEGEVVLWEAAKRCSRDHSIWGAQHAEAEESVPSDGAGVEPEAETGLRVVASILRPLGCGVEP